MKRFVLNKVKKELKTITLKNFVATMSFKKNVSDVRNSIALEILKFKI